MLPLKRHTLVQTICEGQSITVGTHVYKQNGIYSDTLATSSCDSIVTLNLTVQPYKRNTLTKTICVNESITVGIHTYYQTGTYYDTLTTTSCDSIVTLVLSVHALPTVSLGKDTSLCSGQSLLLHSGSGFSNYYWNGSLISSTESFMATTSGMYWVKVINQHGCSAGDTMNILNVYALPHADAGQDKTLCYADSVTLSATGGIHYVWTPGNMQQATIKVAPHVSTTYYVQVTDIHNCSASDDVHVSVLPQPAPLLHLTAMDHCFDDGSTTLTANWGQSFIWLPSGETSQQIQISQEGTYSVTAIDLNHCSYTGQVIVKDVCETKIFLPTGFTPNGDGLHDDVEIFGKNFTNFKITIFNRWGEIIFISTDRNIRWNGIYLGEEMPIGSYPWVVTYESIYDLQHKEQKINGSITLVR